MWLMYTSFRSLLIGPSQFVVHQHLILSGDVELNPGPLDDQKEIEQILATVNDTTFDENDWNVVITECSSLATEWELLSAYLGISFKLIDSIKKDNPSKNSACWNESTKQWIMQNYDTEKFGIPSWQTLLKAVAKVDKLQFKKLAADHQVVTRQDLFHEDIEKCCVRSSPSELSKADNTESKDAEIDTGSAPPAAAKSGSMFAILNPHDLSKEEKETLHQELYADSEDMVYKFQQLFSATSKSLKDRSIPTAVLTSHLQCLGSIKPTFKDSGLPPLRHQLPGLANASAKTIDAVMSVVKDYCSFFNYRMLEHIINELGTEQDKRILAKYKEDFAKYGERHVFQCPSEVGKMSEEGHANMFVTLDDSFDNCTVNHLQSFISNLRKTLKISSKIGLKLCRIKSGSLKLTFQLPHFVQQDIFPLSHIQEAELSDLGVVQLSCGDYQFTTHMIMEVGNDEYSDNADSERSTASMEICETESLSRAAGLTMEKSGDAFSVADSALGRSSYTASTTEATVFSEDILDRELGDFSIGMGLDIITVNNSNSDTGSKLHTAAWTGQLQKVKQLTEEEHLNPQLGIGKEGYTALHYAAAAGHLDVLRYFIEDRACNAACEDHDGQTPLHHAARENHLDVVRYLVENQQMEPFSRTKIGTTALHRACSGGSIDVIRYLAKEMSKYLPLRDVIEDRSLDGFCPLHLTAMYGHLEATKYLITELNADPNATANIGVTVLHAAIYAGHLELVKYLIEHHQQHCDPPCCTIDPKGWHNKTRLIELALRRGHHHIIKHLHL